jgi:hypothetical protein
MSGGTLISSQEAFAKHLDLNKNEPVLVNRRPCRLRLKRTTTANQGLTQLWTQILPQLSIPLFFFCYSSVLFRIAIYSNFVVQRLIFTGLMMGKSLDTAPASRGGLLLETDRLGGLEALLGRGLEAQSGIDQGARGLEVRAPGAQFLLDPIVMCPEDIHHAVGREVVEAIAIGGNDREQSERAHADESVVGL